ncbi:unnamed protein product [Rhizophagus irregularis]|uniref:Uncharacterized protein n=1 Tax=Rhizophagus irregularis TaxID=588596 RepID=A0A915Z1T5_9GLOM|nr:unnamed protein product [Rhizophagus irregularis]CAB5359117.1 unnamed protein product [Rhizophagus irregularis]
MLMWEISSGQPPFINYEHDSNLAINIIDEEQEAFHSKFSIPHNIDDFGESSNQYMSIIGKSDGIFKVLDGGKKLYSMFSKNLIN